MRLAALLVAVAALVAAGCMGEGDAPDEAAPAVEAAQETPTAEQSPGEQEAETEQPTTAAGGGDGEVGVFGRIPEIVRDVEPSVVAVVAGEGEGSGVVWDAEGIVVTNNHVVEAADELVVVFANGRSAEARVRATDPLSDLAILEVEADGLPAADFAEGLPQVGELAVAIGNPLGFQNTVTAGVVSGLQRAIPGGPEALVDLIQTDAAISPGNSGGALVNAEGQVIGINVAYIPPEARAVAIGFAIPAGTVVDVVEELLADGRVEHAFLGVRPAALTPQVAERFGIDVDQGVLVFAVIEGSAAEEAGLQAGDVIVSADGEEMQRVEDLLSFLRQRTPGDTVELRIVRDGEEQTLRATLRDRPQ